MTLDEQYIAALEAELQQTKDLLAVAEETWRGFRNLRLVAENKRLTAKVWAHEEWLKQDSQYDENLRLKAEVKRLREALEQAQKTLEGGYFHTRSFIDNNVPDWVRGDDGPIYWAIKLATNIKAALAAQAPAECHHHRITPECQECKLAREKV